MKLMKDTGARAGEKRIVSRTDATVFMIVAALAAVVSTAFSIFEIAGYFTGPVTLELPVSARDQSVDGLSAGVTGHYTTLMATVPALPSGPAALLACSSALRQAGVLAVQALIFLLAYRLRSAVLFTAVSVRIIGACGIVLLLVGTFSQGLYGIALPRVADLVVMERQAGDEMVLFEGTLSPWPLVLSLVLILVAGVFQYGRRIQQDTDGLV
ncbi:MULTISPECIES: hypothetical protein [unclassified Arthrobacter]|uniref:hypothetical protein n=1 Tax=unclassified Arthrobacter TaxID=235627 RepID=UPI001E54B8C1|nr:MULTISPECIES: hypothetical protein [unclassified Arthrobacter]MCC9145201.1 hypothetical protein [Arthrobacter sp. zg-Y919]MDK1276429.1 hypothetical protein [Arthrobacter sp. zg.Y919]WIB01971.1 hypothetical protein QNO10_08210 [Arthrobacter sp. zg-Y919]